MIKVKNTKSLRSISSSIISISEVQKSNRPYLQIVTVIADDSVNLNGERMSRAFLEDIANRSAEYAGVPLLADTDKIKRGDFKNGLTHLFDPEKGVFLSTQIGSLQRFWTEEINGRLVLKGEAKVFKRDAKVTDALVDLFNEGHLFVSVEVEAGETRIENGVLTVEKSDLNSLIGLCCVSRPAYPSATATYVAAEVEENDAEFIRATEHARLRLAEALAITNEASLNTITGWVYRAVAEAMGEDFWGMSFYNIGMTSALLYNEETGRLFTVNYIIQEDGVHLTDFYESKVVRAQEAESTSEESEEKNLDKVEAEVVEEVKAEATEELQAEAVETVEAEAEETKLEETEHVETVETAEAAEKTEEQAAETLEAEAETETPVNELETKLAEQAKRIAELEEIEAKWLTSQEEQKQAQAAQKKNKLAEYAKTSGLDLEAEAVMAALEALDYERLVSLVLEAQVTDEEQVVTASEKVTNPMVGDMKLTNWLFSKDGTTY